MIQWFWRNFKAKASVRWGTFLLTGLGAVFALVNLGGTAPPSTPTKTLRTNEQPKDGWGATGVGEEQIAGVAKVIRNRGSRELETSSTRVRELQDELARTNTALEKVRESQALALKALAALQEELERVRQETVATPGNKARDKELPSEKREQGDISPGENGSGGGDTAATGPARIRKIPLPATTGKGEEEVNLPRHVRIPAGTFAKATLLTGVYAPVRSQAMPVLLKLSGDAWGPNGSKLPIREALLIGKAQGDPNSARAIVQIQTLSLVQEDGSTIEIPVNAYVTDGDGVQGVAGQYVYRMGEIVALASLTSGLASGADALSMRNLRSSVGPLGNVQQVLEGDALEFAGLKAVGGTLEKLAQIVAKRIDEITPAVYTPNGRQVTVVFIQGADLPGMRIDAGNARRPNYAWEGIDAHRY